LRHAEFSNDFIDLSEVRNLPTKSRKKSVFPKSGRNLRQFATIAKNLKQSHFFYFGKKLVKGTGFFHRLSNLDTTYTTIGYKHLCNNLYHLSFLYHLTAETVYYLNIAYTTIYQSVINCCFRVLQLTIVNNSSL